MKIDKAYNHIRLNLNHRLVRKIAKQLDDFVKANNVTKENWRGIIMLRKYMKHMWKHPNYRRRPRSWTQEWFDKKTIDRCLYFWPNKEINLNKKSPAWHNYYIVDWKSMKAEQLIEYFCSSVTKKYTDDFDLPY